MPHEVIREASIVVVRFHGEADFDEVCQAIEESDTFDTALEMWDMRNPGLDLTTDEIRSLAEHAKLKTHRPQKTALVVGDDLSYGLSRMYSAHRQQEGNETRVFADPDAARNWLLAP